MTVRCPGDGKRESGRCAAQFVERHDFLFPPTRPLSALRAAAYIHYRLYDRYFSLQGVLFPLK